MYMKNNKGKSYIVSTIILTIIVIFSLYLITPLIPLNLKDSIQNAVDSMAPSEGDVNGEGQLIYFGVVSLSAGLMIILSYLIAGFVALLSFIGIIIGFVNRKTERKGLRYYNYVLLGLMSFTLIASIVKMILWKFGY